MDTVSCSHRDFSNSLLEAATAINNAGPMVGIGTLNGQDHAFFLQPLVDDPPPDPVVHHGSVQKVMPTRPSIGCFAGGCEGSKSLACHLASSCRSVSVSGSPASCTPLRPCRSQWEARAPDN